MQNTARKREVQSYIAPNTDAMRNERGYNGAALALGVAKRFLQNPFDNFKSEPWSPNSKGAASHWYVVEDGELYICRVQNKSNVRVAPHRVQIRVPSRLLSRHWRHQSPRFPQRTLSLVPRHHRL